MTSNGKVTPTPDGNLVGRYFHTFTDEGLVEYQGVVLGEPHHGFFLVRTFEWLAGSPYCERLYRIDDMLDWWFYDEAEWMTNTYDHDLSHRSSKAEK
jgi:hypothetical protein